ncbi:LOW QUALITY PROTEIN: methionyl-tRNA formyltransferase, mitochondrial [Syngnathus scovelli]|uniref:LOW QUALITY PROTEIN: methionyl-tRNA formyltransferase, mitochondrial n=1 Tax=Syngnathus scovelli TaxID=161590 RepID=UPI00211054B6|nr:LOW QUALITY PROTEIN: methionyl-tRNA formyltransferase, mitochondrial [Syngnathus scovelli]
MRRGGGGRGAAGVTLAVLRLLRPGDSGGFGGFGGVSAGRTLWPTLPRCPPRRRLCSSGPPWRLLFLGSDHFAVESLKVLAAERSRAGGAVSSLEVATLSADVPVADFARRQHLALHAWPPADVDGRFDVGVVVSFGCLLHQTFIDKFACGILNVHPSLLPRWRGPAPIFHTILNGDAVTGVTIMQIRARRFDEGPILNQALHTVPETSTAERLADVLAVKGARLQLLDTLRDLPRRMADKREQSPTGATFAPKIGVSMSWMVWEEHTCRDIDRLYRAIGWRIPLRTTWMGRTVKLVDFAGRCHISFAGLSRRAVFVWLPLPSRPDGAHWAFSSHSDASEERTPGRVSFHKESDTLAVRCKDGWVAFKAVILNKRLTAADFYNGYLHQTLRRRGGAARDSAPPAAFVSPPSTRPPDVGKRLHRD